MKSLGITKNVCGTDRKIRVYGGLALLGLGFYQTKKERDTAGKVMMVIGGDILLSLLPGFAPSKSPLALIPAGPNPEKQ